MTVEAFLIEDSFILFRKKYILTATVNLMF